MRKKVFYFFVLILLWQPFPVFPQTGTTSTNNVAKEKESFLIKLNSVSTDPAIVLPLSRFFESEVSAIHRSITKNKKLSTLEKEKAERSLVFFIKDLGKNIMQQPSDIYDITGLLNSYRSILNALLRQQPLPPLLRSSGPRQSQLMASTFSQYKEHAILDDIAVYKRVSASPEYILHFLENKPGFRFADSLLLEAAMYDPMRISFYLNSDRRGVQDRIRNASNIWLQQITSLSQHKNASELLPFLKAIAENKFSIEEITAKRTEPLAYFQMLVNTLQESINNNESGSDLLKPLRSGLRQKAWAFYVNEINELHSSADAVRFASVMGLRPQDIYYIITSCGPDLYTSSYLGLYKRLMEHFKDRPADSLFDMVQRDDLRVFLRLAANYNVFNDLLLRLSPEKRKEILHQFITGIEKDESTALERAMDIADSFTALGSASEISELVQAELQFNLSQCISSQRYLGIRLYTILSDILSMVRQEDGIRKLWTTLGDYEMLKHDDLENSKDEIVQLILFYGDEDGVASFNNFLRSYTDKTKWEVEKNENWISIRSLNGQPVVMYANRPLDIREELDTKAQDSLVMFLQQQSLAPTVLVHRGHSYHLDKTLKRLAPSVRLAILGSCGSYNKSISIASINPDVQVIGSKKTGSKSINDPIINMINEELVSGRDLLWPEIWKSLAKRFSKDETAASLFNEYFPPSNNLGLFVLKLFKYHN